MNLDEDDFSADGAAGEPGRTGRITDDLVLDLDGYEGPLDVLLTLARDQKVDITRISILELANQYLDFIAKARRLRLELAAEYLVMAAWLAFLKSRLLLPQPEEAAEPSAAQLAEALQFQLRRLEAMQEAGVRLMARPQLGRDVFQRGDPEGLRYVNKPVYEASLFELLRAYSVVKRQTDAVTLTIEPSQLYSVDEAIQRLVRMLGAYADWQALASFLPPMAGDRLLRKSAMASIFTATLELVRSGRAELRQHKTYGPIFVRSVQKDQ